MADEDSGWLPGFLAGTLLIFFLIWACFHDLAHGDEGTPESVALVLCSFAFALLYRHALRVLKPRSKKAWLTVTGLVIALFSAASVSSLVHPKYPKDPLLASAFLFVGVPVLGLIGFHLFREYQSSRPQSGF